MEKPTPIPPFPPLPGNYGRSEMPDTGESERTTETEELSEQKVSPEVMLEEYRQSVENFASFFESGRTEKWTSKDIDKTISWLAVPNYSCAEDVLKVQKSTGLWFKPFEKATEKPKMEFLVDTTPVVESGIDMASDRPDTSMDRSNSIGSPPEYVGQTDTTTNLENNNDSQFEGDGYDSSDEPYEVASVSEDDSDTSREPLMFHEVLEREAQRRQWETDFKCKQAIKLHSIWNAPYCWKHYTKRGTPMYCECEKENPSNINKHPQEFKPHFIGYVRENLSSFRDLTDLQLDVYYREWTTFYKSVQDMLIYYHQMETRKQDGFFDRFIKIEEKAEDSAEDHYHEIKSEIDLRGPRRRQRLRLDLVDVDETS
ncbi:unnamed protein product [Caenorhabditis brenneri]